MCRVQKDPASTSDLLQEVDVLPDRRREDDQRRIWQRRYALETALDRACPERMRTHGIAVDAEDARLRPPVPNAQRDRSPNQAEPDDGYRLKWRIGSHLRTRPTSASNRLETDAASDRRRNDPEFSHQTLELRREHRLGAVAQRTIGVVMYFDEQAIASCRDRRARELRDHVPSSGAMARIGDHREVAELLHDRNRGDVEGVARGGLERANPAFAEDHVCVAAGEDVFGRQQPLFDRRGDAAFEQDRLPRVTELAQERVVLHVPRADLKDVAVLGNQLDLADVHHLGDDLEVVGVRRAAEHLQSLLAESLERIRRAARLERAAAQDFCARTLDRGRRGVHLLLRLRGARTGHDDHLVTADPDIVCGDDGVLRSEGAAGTFVRFRNAQHLVDPVENANQLGIDLVGADHAEHRTRHAGGSMNIHPELDQTLDDGVDLRLCGPLVHYYDHVTTLR